MIFPVFSKQIFQTACRCRLPGDDFSELRNFKKHVYPPSFLCKNVLFSPFFSFFCLINRIRCPVSHIKFQAGCAAELLSAQAVCHVFCFLRTPVNSGIHTFLSSVKKYFRAYGCE